MGTRVYRSVHEPRREGLSWDELWKGYDNGLIIAWEVGRDLAKKDPELSVRAKNGELPISGWKGGVEKELKRKKNTARFGISLNGKV